jgi:EEF1A N-terminal glycine/lysine methyltransferase
MDKEVDADTGGLFEDPPDFYPSTPPPTTQSHTMKSGQTLTLHLVGHSPLEAHHLWNGSRVISDFFESDPSRVKDKTVLEIGAGAGLPSLVCGMLGAEKVVVTDFPDADLVSNMQKNVDECDDAHAKEDGRIRKTVSATGHVWGGDPKPLLALLPDSPEANSSEHGFDVLILADLLFRHSEHARMLTSVEQTMKKSPDSTAYVFFTSYRPWLQHKDLAFFDLAREKGFVVEKVVELKMDKPLFKDDPGDVEVQKTVIGFTLRWPA